MKIALFYVHLLHHFGVELKLMVDYDSMGPSLQLVRARFLNFSPIWRSRDFAVCKMLISLESSGSWVLSPHCLRLEVCDRECR